MIRGGENISSVYVENCLYEHPAVFDCAVVGLSHPVLGEEVGAVITLKPDYPNGKVTQEEIQKHCRERIAGFMVPVYVEFRRDLLPRNPNGKILKPLLREHLARNRDKSKL